MISRLLSRRPKVLAPPHPGVPLGVAVWAIGDVHGRLDLLEPLTRAILADAEATPVSRKLVIFLGDYVDRGPESGAVLRFLVSLQAHSGVEWRFLKGNHEETMLQFLKDPSVGPQWCEYGGDATLRSYGLSLPNLKHKTEAWARLSADLDHGVEAETRLFLENLELSITVGDYFFVHAGARPGQALDRQSSEDLMWIRRTFLDSEVEFERVVVHGHTPTAEVYADRRRLGIDTKAYSSGVLTCLRLIGQERSLVRAVCKPVVDGGLADTAVSIERSPLMVDGVAPSWKPDTR